MQSMDFYLFIKKGAASDAAKLGKDLRPWFATIPKAKGGKIIRGIIDAVEEIPKSLPILKQLTLDTIEWCKTGKRTFLRQRLELKLADIHRQTNAFNESLKLLAELLKAVKKLDDKPLLVEIQLLESKVHHSLRNIPKAKAALTSARAAANSIYCPPALQADIDLMAGTILAEEKDYKTAYSYFYEAFEGNHSLNKSSLATRCLKYMLLAKIMTENASDVHSIISGKLAINYTGTDIDAMKSVADAYGKRSLLHFEEVKAKYKDNLENDPIIKYHLTDLYENLLEQNISKVIEPFSKVELAHVAKIMQLPVSAVEQKLSQMILDKKLNGILDQGAGCVIIYDDPPTDNTYPLAIETIDNMQNVVDSLFTKAEKLVK